MYEVHDWAEVHRLFHREGLSKSRIAGRLGMSRNTVARLLGLDEPPRYRRKPRGSKLDPYKGSIGVMLERDPRVPARVVFERLRREGYDGGITILKDYLARVRPPRREPRVYQRTSYLPGELAQCDWWQLPISAPVGGGATRKVYGLVTTLPHSAAHAAVFCHSKTTADFSEAFLRTLRRLGGAPEAVVVDRDTSIVVPKSRPARVHDPVAALLGALRIRPIVLLPRRPESKGQVERTIGYLERSFLPLRSFEAIGDVQAQHDRWAQEVAFERHHRRVGAKVAHAWAAERSHLYPLPDPLPDTDRRIEVRVSRDGFCRIGDVDYSTPPELAGRRVSVRVSHREVVIHVDGRQVAHHRRSYTPADVVLDPAHAQALRIARRARTRLARADADIPEVDLACYDALIEAC